MPLTLLVLLALTQAQNAMAAEISIAAVGDIMFGKELNHILEDESPDLPFAATVEALKSADLAVGHLASSLSTRGEAPSNRQNPFRSPPAAARGLAGASIKVVSLANPHMMDYGAEALTDTIDFLSWYGLKSVGAGANLKLATTPVILDIKGTKVAFLAYHHGAQFSAEYADKNTPGTAPAALSLIKSNIAEAKKRSDVLILFIHWGLSSASDPNPSSNVVSERQRFLAQEAINSGADLVLGQKLHTVQGLEIYSQKAILYSLGDYIFGTFDKQQATSVIAKFIFADNKLVKIQLTPILIDNPELKFQPKILKGEEARKALVAFQQLCVDLKTAIHLDGDFGYIDISPPNPNELKKSAEGDKDDKDDKDDKER